MTVHQISILCARIALFVIYFWFGLLKVIGLSPASGMVTELFDKTLSPLLSFAHLGSVTPNEFIIFFGLLEMAIGILILIPGKERIAIGIFFLHMITTTLPLFFLKDSVWVQPFAPTLEGQYVVKNLALIACAFNLWTTVPAKAAKEGVL
jgi:uncharacterized membrane protein YkgB